jgi:hypothetical protein
MQMVNVRFPERAGYGFEMVDVPGVSVPLREAVDQLKIYTESNQSDFPQLFPDLTSMQTLGVYRRLLVKDQLRDQPQHNRNRRLGSRDVFSASYGILARAGARAVAPR